MHYVDNILFFCPSVCVSRVIVYYIADVMGVSEVLLCYVITANHTVQIL